jgi:hypothetical protein
MVAIAHHEEAGLSADGPASALTSRPVLMSRRFRNFLVQWGVRREFIQRLSMVLHGNFASYLRDDLPEGRTYVTLACFPAPGA